MMCDARWSHGNICIFYCWKPLLTLAKSFTVLVARIGTAAHSPLLFARLLHARMCGVEIDIIIIVFVKEAYNLGVKHMSAVPTFQNKSWGPLKAEIIDMVMQLEAFASRHQRCWVRIDIPRTPRHFRLRQDLAFDRLASGLATARSRRSHPSSLWHLYNVFRCQILEGRNRCAVTHPGVLIFLVSDWIVVVWLCVGPIKYFVPSSAFYSFKTIFVGFANFWLDRRGLIVCGSNQIFCIILGVLLF